MQTTHDPLCYINLQYVNQTYGIEASHDQILSSTAAALLEAGIIKIHPLVSLTALFETPTDNNELSVRAQLEGLWRSGNYHHIHPILNPEWYALQLRVAKKSVDDIFSFFVSEGIYGPPSPHPAIRIKPADRSVVPQVYWSSEDTFLNHQDSGTPASRAALDWLSNHPNYKGISSRSDILAEYLTSGLERGDWWFNAENLFGEMLVDLNNSTFADALRRMVKKG